MLAYTMRLMMMLARGGIAAVAGGECGGHPRNGIICSI